MGWMWDKPGLHAEGAPAAGKGEIPQGRLFGAALLLVAWCLG